MAKKKKKLKKVNDPIKPLKYIGYCRAHTPPGDNTSINDLIKFAKFYLCRQNKMLWNDPLWDSYTDEELLIEYFSHVFASDEAARKNFEVEMDVGADIYGEDIYDWLDSKIKENQEEMTQKLDNLPEKISYVPDKNEDKEE